MKLAKKMTKGIGSLLASINPKQILGMVQNRCWTGVACTPGSVRQGAAFFALDPEDTASIEEAIEAGATAIVSTTGDWSARGVLTLWVADVSEALLRASAEFYAHPERTLSVVAVVGGHDSGIISHHTAQLLHASGVSTAMVGKKFHRIAGREIPAAPLTRQIPEYFQLFSMAQREGCRAAVIEWTWDDLDAGEALAIDADVAVLGEWSTGRTGVTPTESQIAATVRWIERSHIQTLVCPADDLFVRKISDRLAEGISLLTYGQDCSGDVVAEKLVDHGMNCAFRLRCRLGAFRIELPLPSGSNLKPVLGATGVAVVRGAGAQTIHRALEQLETTPGYLERVSGCGPLHCFVDAARSACEIEDALKTVRGLGERERRIFLVVGSPEGQDLSERARVVQVAEKCATQVILTSDNPGRESPEAIIQQMKGAAMDPRKVWAEVDRKEALYLALGQMGPEDILLVCGKGGESYQDLGSQMVPWDDRCIIREASASRILGHMPPPLFDGHGKNGSAAVSRIVAL